MPIIKPARFLDSLADQRMMLAPIYEAVLDILGTTATLIPIGSTRDEAADFTTVTTRGGEQVVFTYSEARTAFDTATSELGPARIPTVPFNGTDEEADTPDAAYWSVDDSGDAGFSVGAWVNVTNTASARHILTKYDNGEVIQEWQLSINASDGLRFLCRDDSAGLTVNRASDSAIAQGSWVFVTATYDGTGGTTAMNGVTLYMNGAAVASTATNNGSYGAMENGTSVVAIGGISTGSTLAEPFVGSIAGGPLGPWFVTHDAAGIITADEVLRLYQIGRVGLGV